MHIRFVPSPFVPAIALAATLFASGPLHAFVFTPITDLGLSAGDTYRYLFVSSGTTTAQSTDMSTYNAFATAQARAASAFASTTFDWFAVAATDSVDAVSNVTGSSATLGEPVFLVTGGKIAEQVIRLFDTDLLLAPSVDQYGATKQTTAWTGIEATSSGPPAVSLGNAVPSFGVSNDTSSYWLEFGGAQATNLYSLYAISDVLEVPTVPAPPAAGLLAVGLLPLLGSRLRGRRRLV